MNIKELSELAHMNYHTVRKYYLALYDRGIVTEPTEEVIPLLKQIAKFTSEGLSVQEAINKLVKKDDTPQAFASILLRLEKKIDDLEKENRALRELVQIQLAEMRKMLPKPEEKPEKKKSWFKRLFSKS
ncbi:hypothetical protein [Hippea alviniae]|uniref:hypothetical protein n=1 Tax=Hippea alviniae TaxID=1279027 RepID=UPI0012DD6591|nr:hypothetical protein [Hippea alviniae]